MLKKIILPCTIGTVTLLSREYKTNQKNPYYACKCSACGTEFERDLSGIKRSGCPNCKRLKKEREYKTYIGSRYGDLSILDFAGLRPENPKSNKPTAHMLCRCEKCGKEFEAPLSRIKQGRRKQCDDCQKKAFRSEGQRVMNESRKENTDVSLILPNRKPNKNNKSGVRGVHYDRAHKYWVASIQFQKQQYVLGCFRKKEDAAKARQRAEENLFGNFIDWYKSEYPEEWERLKKRKHLTE